MDIELGYDRVSRMDDENYCGSSKDMPHVRANGYFIFSGICFCYGGMP